MEEEEKLQGGFAMNLSSQQKKHTNGGQSSVFYGTETVSKQDLKLSKTLLFIASVKRINLFANKCQYCNTSKHYINCIQTKLCQSPKNNQNLLYS